MAPLILDGRALAQELRQEVQAAIRTLEPDLGRAPQLAVVQVDGNAASSRYVRTIQKLCATLGATFRLELLPAYAGQPALLSTIQSLNADPLVDGILLQLPLPDHLDAVSASIALDHHKDLDGINPINAGLLAQSRSALVPNTPAGGMELLRRYGITLQGKRATVVGRSSIVGMPMALLLLQANATVTICHSRTADLAAAIYDAEIVCVAAGRPGLVTAEMIRPGAVVVDFGTNVQPDGSLVGDVDFASVAEVAGAITPVPGGTGPVTNVILMRNLVTAARHRAGL
jgi:methylenetetrahydrofolate dehydrogenase (NADP+)/methenyltetrahydrofolate cyclohydrolase